MPLSRRQFIQAAPLLHISTLYSSPALSCGAGPNKARLDLLPLPDFEYLSDGIEDGIEQFLDKTYGVGKWKHSVAPITFGAPEIAESWNSIPIDIRTCDSSLAGRYGRLYVFVQRFVNIYKSGPSCKPYCSSKRSMISRVADFKLGENTIPDLSTRIQILDSASLRMIAVFTRGEVIHVVKQNGSIQLQPCFLDIDGYVL